MVSKEEIVKLEAKLKEGKVAILAKYKRWGDAPTSWHERWFYYAHALDHALSGQEVFSPVHSKAWHILKRQVAIVKWKRTLKAQRGIHPNLQPLESFT